MIGALRTMVALALLAAAGCARDDTSSEGPVSSTTPPAPTHTSGPDTPSPGCVDTFPPLVVPERQETEHGGGRAFPNEAALPERLSETVLYADIGTFTVHPAVQPFTPAHELWSDAADKQRWAYIPECTPVDTSDMDDWQLPVGARLFKEFRVDGRRVETRILTRVGPGPRDFAYGGYLWDEDGRDAVLVGAEGRNDVLGTDHDIPSVEGCLRCHGSYTTGGGRPSRALGFAALALAHDGDGTTLDDLVADGRLSHPPSGPIGFPGDATAAAAIGMLHANCGHCHNATLDGVPQVDLDLWVDASMTTVESTGAWLTAVGAPMVLFQDQHVTALIEPGAPESSALWYRMNARGTLAQMPPLGTEVVDDDGIATLRAWIEAL